MRPLTVVLGSVVALLSGCGGDPAPRAEGARPGTTAAAPAPGGPADTEVRRALRLPARVPLRAEGDAPAEDVAVVRDWLSALSAGEVAKAAGLFALPSRFQNFTSVVLIRSAREALVVSDSLPCGATMTASGGAAGFVVYEARLTARPGADCGAGVGGVVRGAVLVRDGQMVEWYRLPDRSSPRRGEAVIPEGPVI